MKAGFLSNPQPSRMQQPDVQASSNVKKDASAEMRNLPSATVLTMEQWSHNFKECAPLLSSPSDESRFVGLLIAAKLLAQAPPGSSTVEALEQVLKEAGWDFLLRLMAPLVRSASPSYQLNFTPDQLQQQATLTGVGLSVMSALCQLPQVASSSQLQGLVPGFAHLLSSCSITEALQSTQSSIAPKQTTPKILDVDVEGLCRDWPALEDTAVCLYVSCTVPDVQGSLACAGALQSGALQCISKCLSNLYSTAGHHKWSKEMIKVDNVWRLPVLLVRLLCVLLGHAHGTTMGAISWTEEQLSALVHLVPVLCHLLGSPEILSTAKTAAAATAARKQAAFERQQKQNEFIKQLHQQQARLHQEQQQQGFGAQGSDNNVPTITLDATRMLEDALGISPGQASSTTSTTNATGEAADMAIESNGTDEQTIEQQQDVKDFLQANSKGPTEDPALLQLQSLHALLLVLPIVMDVQPHTTAAQHLLNIIACSNTSSPQQRLKSHASINVSLVGWAGSCRRGLTWVLRGRSVGQEQRHAALRVCSSLNRLLGPSWMVAEIQTQADGNSQATADPMLSPSADQFINTLSEILQVELGLLLRDALNPSSSIPAASTSPPEPSDTLVQELHEKAEQLEDLTSAMSQLNQQQQETSGASSQQPVEQDASNNLQTSTPTIEFSTQRNSASSASQTAGQRASQLLPYVLGLLEGLIDVLASQDSMEDEDAMRDDALLPLETQQKLMMSITASVRLVVQFFSTVQQLLTPSSPTGTDVDMPHTKSSDSSAAKHRGAGGADALDSSQADQLAVPSIEVLLACTRFVGSFVSDAYDALDEEMMSVLPVMMLVGIGGQQSNEEQKQAAHALTDMAVQFLLPGLLQASCSTSSTQAIKLRKHMQSDIGLIQCLEGVMGRSAQRAASTHTLNDLESMQQAERLLADTCMLLLNTEHNPQRPVMSSARTAGQTNQSMFQALEQISIWYRNRVHMCFSKVQVGSGTHYIDKALSSLAASGLIPRAILCTAAWCMSVMQHNMQGLSQQCLESLIDFIAHAEEVGYVLALAQYQNINRTDSIIHIVDDFAGDGEQCFEWLLDLTCTCVAGLPRLKQSLLNVLPPLLNMKSALRQDVADQFPSLILLARSLGVEGS